MPPLQFQSRGSLDPSVSELRYMAYKASFSYPQSEAGRLFRQMVDKERWDKSADQSQLRLDLMGMAIYYVSVNQFDIAEDFCQKSIDIQETLAKESPIELARNRNYLAGLYFSQKKFAGAERLCEAALRVDEKTLGSNHPATAIYLNHLADIKLNLAKYVEAEKLYGRALDIDKKCSGEQSPDFARDLSNIASLRVATGRLSDAEKYYRQSLKIYQNAFGENGFETIKTQEALNQLQEGTIDSVEVSAKENKDRAQPL